MGWFPENNLAGRLGFAVVKKRHMLILKPMSAIRYADALLKLTVERCGILFVKLSLSGGPPRLYDPPDYLQAPVVARTKSRPSRIVVVSLFRLSNPRPGHVRVTLQLTVSPVCLGVQPRLGLMTRCFFLLESYCPVHVGRPL
jgi:hypothetical protein